MAAENGRYLPKCPQCAVEFLEEQKRDAQAEIDRAVREKHFAGAMLPERHATSGFKNYKVQHAGQQNALNQVVSFAKNMIHVDFGNEEFHVSGYISKIDTSRSSKNHIVTLVN